MINRMISNEDLLKEIEDQFYTKDMENIKMHVLVFEETGLMDVHLWIDEQYLECEILNSENDIIGLQKELKEIGSLLCEKYNVIPKVEFTLWDGLKEEIVFG